MRRFLSKNRLFSALLVGLACGPSRFAQTVVTEPAPRFLPGGINQKPFDITRHTIPVSEIKEGGPARDAVPAVVHPRFMTARETKGLLRNKDRVLGIFWNGEAKAYPVRILNWHELVNDTVGGRPVLVTW
jgi:uncharacterized protein DUF3179